MWHLEIDDTKVYAAYQNRNLKAQLICASTELFVFLMYLGSIRDEVLALLTIYLVHVLVK